MRLSFSIVVLCVQPRCG